MHSNLLNFVVDQLALVGLELLYEVINIAAESTRDVASGIPDTVYLNRLVPCEKVIDVENIANIKNTFFLYMPGLFRL